MSLDLLIVGAGPAGLTLAHHAFQRDLSFRIIDSGSVVDRPLSSRATGIQPRLIQLLDALDILDQVRAEAIPLLGNSIYCDGKPVRTFSFFDARTGEHGLSLDQSRIESFLEQQLVKNGVVLERESEFLQQQQSEESVRSLVTGPGGEREEIESRFVIGCDGGRSAVRKSAGIAFPGHTYDELSFVSDGKIVGDVDPGFMHYCVAEDSRLVLVPLRREGHFKISGALPKGELQQGSELVSRLLLRHLGPRAELVELNAFRTYKMHARCADHFQDRRILLCGDAAHLFPPNGGQGLNVAMEDACALSDFLIEACDAGVSVLRPYEARREMVLALLSDIRSTKDRYSYENVRQMDAELEQERIRRVEL